MRLGNIRTGLGYIEIGGEIFVSDRLQEIIQENGYNISLRNPTADIQLAFGVMQLREELCPPAERPEPLCLRTASFLKNHPQYIDGLASDESMPSRRPMNSYRVRKMRQSRD